MADVKREKYVALMTRIEEAEDRLAELEKQRAGGTGQPDLDARIAALNESLAADRRELARLSDGCGRPWHE
ncbi:MAG: hypothetical protein PHU85_16075 [Phycisphaerae bacterium]|nr:hypothetical protein [Phycisphaerae bacterium]